MHLAIGEMCTRFGVTPCCVDLFFINYRSCFILLPQSRFRKFGKLLSSQKKEKIFRITLNILGNKFSIIREIFKLVQRKIGSFSGNFQQNQGKLQLWIKNTLYCPLADTKCRGIRSHICTKPGANTNLQGFCSPYQTPNPNG